VTRSDTRDAPAIAAGFPAGLRQDAEAVARRLPASEHPAIGCFSAIVDDEAVYIPYRIYNPELSGAELTALTPTQQLIARCVYTRHHDGHVRQRCCEQIIGSPHTWIAPYVVYLAGEYVVEIADFILGELDEDRSGFGVVCGQFSVANPALLEIVRQRAVSYWDCYYRAAYSRDSYPGLAVIAALERAATRARTQDSPQRRSQDRRSQWERAEEARHAAAGRHGRRGHRCQTCRGTGRVPGATPRRGSTGYSSRFGACPECGGSGYVDDEAGPDAP